MKEQSTTRGFAILSLAGILAKLLSLLYVPLLQGLIGTGGYGIYQKTYEIFVFLYAVLNLGMQTAIAKYVSELEAVGNHRDALRTFRLSRTLLLVFGTLLTALLILSAKFIAYRSENPNIYIGLIALAPAIALTSVLCSYRGYFQGRNLMTPLAVSQVLEQLVNVALSLMFAFYLMRYGVEYGSAGATLGTSIGALVAIYYLIFTTIRKKFESDIKSTDTSLKRLRGKVIIKRLITYGFPIALSAGLQNFGAVVDMFNVNARLIYAGFSTSQADELYGILGFYKTLLYVPLIIITALGTAVMPAISRALVLKEKDVIKEKILFAIRMTYTVTIPAAFGLAVLSSEVYKVLFGIPQGHELMLYGSIVVVFMAVVQIQNTVLQSINQFYFVVISLLIGIIFKIASNYILIGYRDINIKGAVVGGILCFLVPMILNHGKLCRALKIKFSLMTLALKPIISSVIMAIFIYALKSLFFGAASNIIGTGRFISAIPLLLTIVIGGFIYIYVMIYIGGVRKKELEGFSPRALTFLPGFMKKNLR